MKAGRKGCLVVASAALWLAGDLARAQTIDLGTLPGGTLASGWGINENGDVAGVSDDASGCDKPFIVATRSPNALQMVDLGTFGGCTPAGAWLTMSMAINNHSLLVGHAPNPLNQIRPFAWTEKLGKVELGTLEGHADAIPWRVNDNGIIVGQSAIDFRNGVDIQPVVWLPDEKTKTWHIQKLDTKGFEAYSGWHAMGINRSGQIVGITFEPVNGFPVPIVWNPLPDGKSWKASKLEVPQGCTGAFARYINEHGEIAGAVTTADWNALPVVWKPLATPSGDDVERSGWRAQLLAGLWGNQQTVWTWAFATAVNDKGDIVGFNGYNAGGPDFWLAVSWRIDKPESVHQLFQTSSEAFHINNDGVATGDYVVEVNGAEQTHAFAIRIPKEGEKDKPESH